MLAGKLEKCPCLIVAAARKDGGGLGRQQVLESADDGEGGDNRQSDPRQGGPEAAFHGSILIRSICQMARKYHASFCSSGWSSKGNISQKGPRPRGGNRSPFIDSARIGW